MSWTSSGRRAKVSIAVVLATSCGAVTRGLVGASTSAGAGKHTQCLGQPATIVGTSGNDVIAGTNGTDVIVAGKGRDQVNGRGGDDFICGEGGNDILLGGSGDDQISAGAGRDYVFGGSGDDFMAGGGGSDEMHGGSGEDTMYGDTLINYRDDVCDGGEGNNDSARADCESTPNVP